MFYLSSLESCASKFKHFSRKFSFRPNPIVAFQTLFSPLVCVSCSTTHSTLVLFEGNKNSMERLFSNNNSKVPKLNISMGNNQFFMAPGHYYHPPESPNFDSYSTDAANLENLDSPIIKYLRSDAFKTPVIDGSKYRPVIGNMYHRSNSHSRGSSASPLSAIENLESPPSRSPPVFKTPVKVEEDVLVIDDILVGAVPGAGLRSSSSSDSGGSSSSGGKVFYKTEICRSWEDSGRCRYSSKCQFAHGKEELRLTRFPHKNKSEAQTCKSYPSGSCKFGSKCRFVHHQANSPASLATQIISPIKQEHNTLVSTDWSPLDDGIEITLPPPAPTDKAPSREDVEHHISSILYGPIRRKRLSVFTKICPE